MLAAVDDALLDAGMLIVVLADRQAKYFFQRLIRHIAGDIVIYLFKLEVFFEVAQDDILHEKNEQGHERKLDDDFNRLLGDDAVDDFF